MAVVECGECVFWSAIAKTLLGTCHVHAPRVSENSVTAVWAETKFDDFCGEGELIPDETD